MVAACEQHRRSVALYLPIWTDDSFLAIGI